MVRNLNPQVSFLLPSASRFIQLHPVSSVSTCSQSDDPYFELLCKMPSCPVMYERAVTPSKVPPLTPDELHAYGRCEWRCVDVSSKPVRTWPCCKFFSRVVYPLVLEEQLRAASPPDRVQSPAQNLYKDNMHLLSSIIRRSRMMSLLKPRLNLRLPGVTHTRSRLSVHKSSQRQMTLNDYQDIGAHTKPR